MSLSGAERRPGLNKRSLMAGPTLGFYELLTASVPGVLPGTMKLQWHMDSDARIVAFGWHARDVSGGAGSTINLAKPTSATAAGAGLLVVDTMTMDGKLGDVARTEGTTPAVDGTNRIIDIADRDWLRVTTGSGTNTITDLNVWVLLWRVKHINVDPAED